MIDINAAFDIDLALQIPKNEIGIQVNALRLFKSLLSGRKQRVLIEKFLSKPVEVQYGVSQGSVLGTTLFNIYIHILDLCMN